MAVARFETAGQGERGIGDPGSGIRDPGSGD